MVIWSKILHKQIKAAIKQMKYITLINKFWALHEVHSFQTTEIALFFYLLKINNQCSWIESFKRNNARIEADLGCSYHILKNARNKLKQCGVVDYKAKNGTPNVEYSMTLQFNYEVTNEVSDEVANEVSDEVRSRLVMTKDRYNNNNIISKNKSKNKKIYLSNFKYSETILLTDDEYSSLLSELGVSMLERCIKKIYDYSLSNATKFKKYTDHNRVIRTWVIKSVEDDILREKRHFVENASLEIRAEKLGISINSNNANSDYLKPRETEEGVSF